MKRTPTNGFVWSIQWMKYTRKTCGNGVFCSLSKAVSAIGVLGDVAQNHFPIQFMPEDLLVEILLRVDNPLKLSQVNHAWRVLHNVHPQLWSYISLSRPRRLLEEYLSRSQSAPLFVVANLTVPYPEYLQSRLENLRLVLKHLPRIRSLRVGMSYGSLSQEMMSVLKDAFVENPASILRTLSLGQYNPFYTIQEFPFHLPSLRDIHLTNMFLSWDALIFRKLTSLSITFTHADMASFIDTQGLLGILVDCPDLEMLHLSLDLPKEPQTLTDDSDMLIKKWDSTITIDLLFLRDIAFNNLPVSMCQLIAASIHTPRNASWTIFSVFPDPPLGNENTIALLIQRISSSLKLDESQRRSLKMSFWDAGIVMQSSPIRDNDSRLKHVNESQIGIHLRHSSAGSVSQPVILPSAFPHIVSEIVEAFNFYSNIVHFGVGFIEPYRAPIPTSPNGYETFVDIWRDILQVLPELKYLSYAHPYPTQLYTYDYLKTTKTKLLDHLISTLDVRPVSLLEVQDFRSKSRVLCPNLSVLEIAYDKEKFSSKLLQCLASRNSCGLRLRSVRLTWTKEDEISRELLSNLTNFVDSAHIEGPDGILSFGSYAEEDNSIIQPFEIIAMPVRWGPILPNRSLDPFRISDADIF